MCQLFIRKIKINLFYSTAIIFAFGACIKRSKQVFDDTVSEIQSNSNVNTYKNVTILMYHGLVDKTQFPDDVSIRNFKEQLTFLHENNYKTISLSEMEKISKGTIIAPPKALLLTFDDGFESDYTVAKPALESLNMKASFFVVTGFAGIAGLIWPRKSLT